MADGVAPGCGSGKVVWLLQCTGSRGMRCFYVQQLLIQRTAFFEGISCALDKLECALIEKPPRLNLLCGPSTRCALNVQVQ